MVENALGFVPARPVVWPVPPVPDVRRVVFRAKKILVGLVFDAAHLEGSPYTFPEVQTLLDGVTVGGHRLEDQRLILNLRAAWEALLGAVLAGQFTLSQDRYCALHRLVAAEEALAWGTFRTGSVEVAGTTTYTPPPAETLGERFAQGLAALQEFAHPVHRAVNFFLFGAYQKCFWAGNRRTARLMMNGVLMQAGLDALSVPARARREFNEAMLRFYDRADGREMGDLLLSYAPDSYRSSGLAPS